MCLSNLQSWYLESSCVFWLHVITIITMSLHQAISNLLPCYCCIVLWFEVLLFVNWKEKFQEVIPNNGLLLCQQVIVFSQIQPIESNRKAGEREKRKRPVDALKTKTKPEHGSHWRDSTGPESLAHEKEEIRGSWSHAVNKILPSNNTRTCFSKSNMHFSGLKKYKYIFAIQISKCLW